MTPFFKASLAGLLAGTLLLVFSGTGIGRQFCTDRDVAVKTVSLQPTPGGQSGKTRHWVLRFKQKDPGGYHLGFFLQGQDRELAGLDISRQDGISYSYQEFGRPARAGEQAFLLTLSSPVPCNLLPVPAESPLTISSLKEAGQNRFRRDYRITREPIDWAEARKRGWVTKTSPAAAGGLYVLLVTDVARDVIVLKQLWQENACWWLFEQTTSYKAFQIQK
ncbi:MAG: hypothetical protein K9J81_11780 [Desulfohalobiaceae bacterium]|nr:hypothetical protein [Desulfohalobiaceae bacterium]